MTSIASTGRFRRTSGQSPDVLNAAPQAAPRDGSSVVANFILLAGLLLVSNRANARR